MLCPPQKISLTNTPERQYSIDFQNRALPECNGLSVAVGKAAPGRGDAGRGYAQQGEGIRLSYTPALPPCHSTPEDPLLPRPPGRLPTRPGRGVLHAHSQRCLSVHFRTCRRSRQQKTVPAASHLCYARTTPPDRLGAWPFITSTGKPSGAARAIPPSPPPRIAPEKSSSTNAGAASTITARAATA